MKPVAVAQWFDEEIARTERRLDRLRQGRSALDDELPVPVRPRARVGTLTERKQRGKVRKVRAAAAQLAPGGLADRIVKFLREQACPVRKAVIVTAVKARTEDVQTALKRLREAGQVVMSGATSAVRYALPEFAHVVVAEG